MTVPDTWRVPGIYLDVVPSLIGTGPGAFPLRAVIIAQGGTGGTAESGTLYLITRLEQVADLFGAGSPAHFMAREWLSVNPLTELYMIASEVSGGSAADGYFLFGGTISTPFTAAFYVAGRRVEVLMETSPTVCGDNLVAAINGDANFPVTAVNAAGNVTLTAKFEGAIGHTIDLRVNHLPGEEWGDSNLTLNIVQPTGGTGMIVLSNALAGMAGFRWDVICHPYYLATQLDEIQSDLEDRADALVGWPGMGFSGRKDTHANLLTLGDSRNGRFECIFGMETFPGWDIARGAGLAGMAARYLQEDPVRPVTGRAWLNGYAPVPGDLFTGTERNLLLHDGISTVLWADDGRASVERLISTYQETAGGSPDDTFLDVQTMFGLAYCRRSYVARFAARFPNHKLAPDGTPARPDSHIVTPQLILDDAAGWYRGLVEAGICTDVEGFIRDSTAEISDTDPNRVEIYLAVDLMNQLRVADAILQFRR